MMFDLLIFAGKIKKPPLGYFFSRVNKKLLLQSHVGPPVAQNLFKNPDFKVIHHFRVDSYHTLPWPQMFFLIFLFFLEVAKLSRDSCSPISGSLAALSCGEKTTKTSVTRVTTHQQLQLHHVKISAKSTKTTSNKICF